MNDKKFAFIICTNNDMYLNECLLYLSNLNVPEGYTADVFTITEAEYMTKAYNEAIAACDAKYKIYMHQDLFIINPFFLFNILDIFKRDENIGLIGFVGYKKLSPIGMMWSEDRFGCTPLFGVYKCYGRLKPDYFAPDKCYDVTDVAVIDGLCMITQYDLPWDEDFDKWDFYDASQSMNFHTSGYRVVVPNQDYPWFVHDDGRVLSLANYDKYREIFVSKYSDYLGKDVNEMNRHFLKGE